MKEKKLIIILIIILVLCFSVGYVFFKFKKHIPAGYFNTPKKTGQLFKVENEHWRTQDERLAPLTSPKLEALGLEGDD